MPLHEIDWPTEEEAGEAGPKQLGYWLRYLPSPGWKDPSKMEEQEKIMNVIYARFYDRYNGWNPGLSKDVDEYALTQ